MASANARPGQSDPAAVEAMRTVIAQSGGQIWSSVRSAVESFSVQTGENGTPRVMRLLDDWAQDTMRYRRREAGQTQLPEDHSGGPTFAANLGSKQLVVPEFDQARVLVGRLPAAAAEVMLRRHEYILKISASQSCSTGDICVDVYRSIGNGNHQTPEQQWKISSSTGLPKTVRYQTVQPEATAPPMWREVYFMKYGTEDGVNIPVAIAMVWHGRPETWTLTSMKKNVGFDAARFDQEAAQ